MIYKLYNSFSKYLKYQIKNTRSSTNTFYIYTSLIAYIILFVHFTLIGIFLFIFRPKQVMRVWGNFIHKPVKVKKDIQEIEEMQSKLKQEWNTLISILNSFFD